MPISTANPSKSRLATNRPGGGPLMVYDAWFVSKATSFGAKTLKFFELPIGDPQATAASRAAHGIAE